MRLVVRTTRTNHAYAWTGHYNVERGYDANGLNQYGEAGPTGFEYDANGNLVRSADRPRITHYAYDIENRLVRATGASTASLVYDPLGRLFQVSGGSAGPIQFLYDGDELVGEYDGVTGAMTQRYVHGAGVDDPLIWYVGSGLGVPRFLHSDHQGSITAIATGAGAVLLVNSYDEYGIPAPSAMNLGRFAYTGQVWIPELEMYHYKARVYSPTLGRFLQTDPVGYEDQINLYAYVGNDPANASDPSGQQSCRKPPCPDVRLRSESLRSAARQELGQASRLPRAERGLQLYVNRKTGERKFLKGRAAGRGAYGEFAFKPNPQANSTLMLISHTHNGSDQKGLQGTKATRTNNAPSELDQEAMHQWGVAVQVVGTDISGTLYRKDNQDYFQVEVGDAANVPNLESQHIIVIPAPPPPKKEDPPGG